jgi:predicted nicotinamide N-methyase
MSLAARWIPGGWTEREVVLRGRTFSLLVPAQPDDVLYHLEAHADAAATLGADPYWAQLWPTSLHLAEKILASDWPQGATAIELGCGIGLAGLAALEQGMHVTLSGYNPLAVELAVENARRSGFTNVNGLVLDWRQPPQHTFDVILASDVIYDRDLHIPLVNTIETLSHERTITWIADGGRSATEDFVYIALERLHIDLFDLHDRPSSSLHLGEYRRIVCRPRRGS